MMNSLRCNWGRASYGCTVERGPCLRTIFTSAAWNNKGYYESLELTPKATQAEIKAAYYKLSMRYHPDKNKGKEDAATKFREITLAYEVLGSHRLRKMYDKGILHTAGGPFPHATTTYENMEEALRAEREKTRGERRFSTPMSGRTTIYDFDEWSRQHYSDTLAKKATAKEKWKTRRQYEFYERRRYQTHSVLFTMIFLFSVGFMFTMARANQDNPRGPRGGSDT